MQVYSDLNDSTHDIRKIAHFIAATDWSLIYILMMLATTLMCTTLILYRIVCLAQRIFLLRSVISALIESSAIYTMTLIMYLALVMRNGDAAYYGDVIVAYTKVNQFLY